MQVMNVLLIDNSPHLQKTLQYFLHPYAPSFYSTDSQKELPQKIDIVFLDSGHKDNKHLPDLKNKKTPIVLISRDEKTLKEMGSGYSAVLKKPVQYTKLQEIIHHLIPETRSFKASPYLKFYERNFAQEEQPLSLNQVEEDLKKASEVKLEKAEEPPAAVNPKGLMDENLKTTPAAKIEEDIPLMPNEDLKNQPTTDQKTPLQSKTSKTAENQQPAFDKKPAVVILDDIKLTDEMDSTSLHNTNTFLKKVSESIKGKTHLEKKETEVQESTESEKSEEFTMTAENETPAESEKSEEFTMTAENETPAESEVLQSSPEDSSKPLSKEESEDLQMLKALSETPIDSDQEQTSEAFATTSSDLPKSPPASEFMDLKHTEKWDTLSDKIIEIIDKHFQEKWETFINTQLKKDLKEMIHREVTHIFKEQMKDILTTEGIQSIKKASEEISWKVIPELSKQIIQKEINKLMDKP